MLNLELIGNKITKHRKLSSMTQYELADTLYVTHQAVSKWENGKSVPSIEILLELTKLFQVSIDYLLDDAEIKEDDYASLITNYSRESAINHFINSKTPNDDISKIFYLLSSKERTLILNLLISGNIKLDISILFNYLTDKERIYLLSAILSNKIDYNISHLQHKLSNTEAAMVFQLSNSKYKYPLHQTHFTIKE